MHIGMFYQVQVPKPWNSTSDADRHWDMMDQVALADELGCAAEFQSFEKQAASHRT